MSFYSSVDSLLRIALDPLLGGDLPFLMFYPAVMVSAWLGGVWSVTGSDWFPLVPGRGERPASTTDSASRPKGTQ